MSSSYCSLWLIKLIIVFIYSELVLNPPRCIIVDTLFSRRLCIPEPDGINMFGIPIHIKLLTRELARNTCNCKCLSNCQLSSALLHSWKYQKVLPCYIMDALQMCICRQLIDYDKPVSVYWPEFAQSHKDKVTVRELLAEQVTVQIVVLFIEFDNLGH